MRVEHRAPSPFSERAKPWIAHAAGILARNISDASGAGLIGSHTHPHNEFVGAERTGII